MAVIHENTTGNKYIGEKYRVGNYTFYVYLPENIDDTKDVSATFYFPGLGGYSYDCEGSALSPLYSNGFTTSSGEIVNQNSIFISSPNSNYNSKYVDALNELISYISTENRESSLNINISYGGGNSAGGGSITNYYLDVLRKLSNGELSDDSSLPKSLLLFDPYGYGDSGRPTYAPKISETEIELMKEKKSQVVFFTHDGRFNGSLKYANDFLDKLAYTKELLPIIVSINGGSSEHPFMTKIPISDGWQLYFDGKINLEDIKNDYEYVNPRNGKTFDLLYSVSLPTFSDSGELVWKKYSLKELINIKNKIANSEVVDDQDKYALFSLEWEAVKVNHIYLDHIAEIAQEGLNICNTDIENLSYSSTSELLSNEANIINKLNSSINNVSVSFNSEINNIINSRVQYLMLEKELKEQAESVYQLFGLNNK